MGVIIAAILTIVLMGLSAFASGSEIAFFSLSPSDMAEVNTLRRESILVAISVAHRTLNLPSVTLWRDYAKSVQSSKPVGILS